MCRPSGSRLSRVALLLVLLFSTSSRIAAVSNTYFSSLGYQGSLVRYECDTALLGCHEQACLGMIAEAIAATINCLSILCRSRYHCPHLESNLPPRRKSCGGES